jgi:hypothetical protein
MARRIPEGVLVAAREHAREWHEIDELDERELGRRNSRTALRSIIWQPAADARGATFRCRLCPGVFDYYYVDLYAPVPTEGVLSLIRGHFASEHEIAELPLEEIAYEGNTGPGGKAVWLPMTEQLGAGIVCLLCAEGMKRIFLTEPPHGDARRLHQLLRQHPEQQRELRRRTPVEADEYLEAWDRELVATGAEPRDVRNALARARERPPEASNLRDQALERILREGVRDGARITALIKELVALSREDAIGFAVRLGRALPEFVELGVEDSDEDFAAFTVKFFGASSPDELGVSEPTLWRIWGGVKDSGVRVGDGS